MNYQYYFVGSDLKDWVLNLKVCYEIFYLAIGFKELGDRLMQTVD